MYKIQSDTETFLGNFEDLDEAEFNSLKKAKAAIPELREVGFTSNLRIVDESGHVVAEFDRDFEE